jgi:hypothetical protein
MIDDPVLLKDWHVVPHASALAYRRWLGQLGLKFGTS